MKICQKMPKNHFFSKKMKFLKILVFRRKKKNAFPLVLPIEEIILRPELSSPPSFRIQGGYRERYGRTDERKSSCLILDSRTKPFTASPDDGPQLLLELRLLGQVLPVLLDITDCALFIFGTALCNA